MLSEKEFDTWKSLSEMTREQFGTMPIQGQEKGDYIYTVIKVLEKVVEENKKLDARLTMTEKALTRTIENVSRHVHGQDGRPAVPLL